MIIYHYDKNTGVYAGDGEADESPMEPGVYLFPAHSTTVQPPQTCLNTVAVFNGDDWDVVEVEDRRAPFERAWRNAELHRADIELNKIQDGEEAGLVGPWRKYRVALRNWPENEKFPDHDYRPTAPDKSK